MRLPAQDRWARPAGERDHLVEPEHEEELRRFVAYANANGRRFVFLMLTFAVFLSGSAIVAAVWKGAIFLVHALMALLGAAILKYPFATPETVQAMGMKGARKAARTGGLLILGMSVAFTLLEFFRLV